MDEVVKYKPYTIKQEKGFITALEGDEKNDVIANFEEIIKQCILNDIDFKKLTIVDFLYLAVKIRASSKGSIIELKHNKCDECGKPFEFEIDLDEQLKYKNEEKRSVVCDVTDDLKLELQPTAYQFMYEYDNMQDEYDLYINSSAYSTKTVFYKDEIYKEFSIDELKEMISEMTEDQIKKIFKTSDELIGVYLNIDAVCPHCKHKHEEKVDDFLKFLS
jgi:hypothetical protein